MEEQDRVSQASSLVTISAFPLQKQGRDDKVQTFGKRCRAARRDPNCPVVIRGWLHKKDSSGLKLWKRRWFVLSNYCLFYYKDSREESVLGSIPLPSYKILFCSARECRNRKFTFKVVHQGMRPYYFSADTQEDMLGWVRALSQSAAMEPDSALNRRCSSYQDFTQLGGSSESVQTPLSVSVGDDQRPRHVARTLSEPSHMTGGRMGGDHRGRRSTRQSSLSPPEASRRNCTQRQGEDSLSYETVPQGRLGSRPHTPVGRVDMRPLDDPGHCCYAPGSPSAEFSSASYTPVRERRQNANKPVDTYGSVHHIPVGRRPLGKSQATGGDTDCLPPLPPTPPPPAEHLHHHHHHHHRSHLSVCLLPAPPPKADLREAPPIRPLESDADAVLTRLCGCDKLLQSLSVELAQLQLDKESVHCALEMTHLQVDDWPNQTPHTQEVAFTQKALLQEELVTIRARMCDVSLEMEQVWGQYERMESELSVIRSQLQHICNFGMPQEQSRAQRQLWMMEDILSGLKVNRDHFSMLQGLHKHHIPSSVYQSLGSPIDGLQTRPPKGAELDPPARPPLPQELQGTNQIGDHGHDWMDLTYESVYSSHADEACRQGSRPPGVPSEEPRPAAADSQPGLRWTTPDGTVTSNQISSQKARMTSEVEQAGRMKKKRQDRPTNNRKPPTGVASQGQPREEAPFPLRVTRVVSAVLPSSLVARKVSVEDLPPGLAPLLAEQIPSEGQLSSAGRLETEPPGVVSHQDQPCRGCQKVQPHSDVSGATTGGQSIAQRYREDTRLPGDETGPPESSVSAQPRAQGGTEDGNKRTHNKDVGRPSVVLTSDPDPDLFLTPEQREAKLRRVQRIRERIIHSAVRESANAPVHPQLKRKRLCRTSPAPTRHALQTSRAPSDTEVCEAEVIRDSDDVRPNYDPAEDEEDKLASQSNQSFGNRAQHKGYNEREGHIKARSSCHTTSVTVYRKGGQVSTTGPPNGPEEHERPINGSESDSSSANLRSEWFLSTNHWQGFIPLQKHGVEPPGQEEISNTSDQQEGHDSITDCSDVISAIVSQSLENHSLFYKIACDLSISDTDIQIDGNPNIQAESKPEDSSEEPGPFPEELTERDVRSSEQHIRGSSSSRAGESLRATSEYNRDSLPTRSTSQDSSQEQQKMQYDGSDVLVKELCIYEELPDKENNNGSSKPQNLVGDVDISHGAPGCSDVSVQPSKSTDAEEPEDRRMAKKSNQDRNSIVQSRSFSELGREMRTFPSGKPRVTVLRTSL